MKCLLYSLALVCTLVFALPASAQYWTDLGEAKGGVPDVPRQDLKQYRSFQLDWQGLADYLSQVPAELNPQKARLAVEMPARNGQLETFAIVEYLAMEPPLAAKYPDIHTYWGVGIDDPGSSIRITNSPNGIFAVILDPEGSVFLESLPDSRTQYAVFMKSDAVELSWQDQTCQTFDGLQYLTSPLDASAMRSQIGEEFLTYRLAISTTSLFTNNVGGVNNTINNLANAVNAINGIFERDIAVRFQLVANNDQLIFTNSNDPFTSPTDLPTTMNENQAVVDSLIGDNSYDIGHVLSLLQFTTGGGVSILTALCTADFKARGCSAKGNPPFSIFYFEVLAHEVGHQLGAFHNYNTTASACGAGNHTPQGAREPGSGTTIMCYSGLCAPHNIQTFTDDYFHSGSIARMIQYTRSQGGSICIFASTNTNNLPPVVDGGVSELFLPISTPFVLSGSATDPDGDAITYCWDEMDQGPPGPPSSPVDNAPVFRSFPPVTTPVRTFPRIQDVINNIETMGEHLPDYSRDLNFRLTVRDNLGGVGFDDVSFEVSNLAGPFLVTHPNAVQTFTAGNIEEVRWDVANTNQFPVNSQYVTIKLSVDGGFTYPYTLADSVANDGAEYVVYPNVTSSSCRVRVEAADHIFFDLSNRNFTIQLPSSPGFTVLPTEDTLRICGQGSSTWTVLSSSLLGFSDPIAISFGSLPTGISLTTNMDTLLPGESLEATFTGDGTTSLGVYLINMTAVPTNGLNETVSLQLQVLEATTLPAAISMIAPISATNLVLAPAFSWTPDPNASSYGFEIATSPSFSSASIVHTAIGVSSIPYSLPFDLNSFSVYYWRVRGESPCGDGPFQEISAFQTGDCHLVEATDLPITLPSFGAPAVGSSTVSASASGTVSSVGIQNVLGTHDGMGEIAAKLISPAGTEVQLFNAGDLCEVVGNDEFDLNFDPSGASSLPCPPNDGLTYAPVGDFSQFIGEAANGNWSLEITDQTNFNGGQLQDWDLILCTESFPAPELLSNLLLTVNRWSLDTIRQFTLEAISPNTTPNNVTFTLVNGPGEGGLKRNGITLQAGESFTQDDINNHRISYLHYGNTIAQDAFTFDVRNQAGGWIGIFTFNIEIIITTGIESILPTGSLNIYPNPARDRVWVEIDQNLVHDIGKVELYTIHGQILSHKTFSGGASRIFFETGTFVQGLYFIKINTARGSQLEKLLIEK